MARNFHQLREFLETRNSNLIGDDVITLIDTCYSGSITFLNTFSGFVEGANYPPPKEKQILGQVLSFLFMGGIAVLLGGDTIFQTLNIPEPELYQSMKANKMTSFLLLFLLNNVGNSMLTTGAFEIFIDGEYYMSCLSIMLIN